MLNSITWTYRRRSLKHMGKDKRRVKKNIFILAIDIENKATKQTSCARIKCCFYAFQPLMFQPHANEGQIQGWWDKREPVRLFLSQQVGPTIQ